MSQTRMGIPSTISTFGYPLEPKFPNITSFGPFSYLRGKGSDGGHSAVATELALSLTPGLSRSRPLQEADMATGKPPIAGSGPGTLVATPPGFGRSICIAWPVNTGVRFMERRTERSRGSASSAKACVVR